MKAIVATRSGSSTRVDLDQNYDAPSTSSSSSNNKSNELLTIRLLASPINPSDVVNVKGGFPYTTFPRVPGRDFAGVVTAPANHPLHGKKVFGTSGNDFSFTADGAHAEFFSVSADGVVEIPGNIDAKAASVMGTPWTTAHLCLRRARPEKGETLLVLGAGGAVGQAAVRLAGSSLFGCKVLKGGRGGKGRGYDVDISVSEDGTGFAEVNDLTGGKGVDVVVDTTGDAGVIKEALGKLAVGGRLTIISAIAATTFTMDLKSFYRDDLSIIGCNSVLPSQRSMAESLRAMCPLLESGEIEAPSLSGYTQISLEETMEAYNKLMHGARGKYVVVQE